MMRDEYAPPTFRDWLGWLFSALLLIIGGLSGIAWNDLNAKVNGLELYGSAPMRVNDARHEAQIMDLQRRLSDLQEQVSELRQLERERRTQ